MDQKRAQKSQISGGFTLIEIIVAVAVFSIVMLVSAGSLLSILDSNRKAQSTQSVMTNLNFALESMTRSMRVGDTYHCGTLGVITTPLDCPDGATGLAYEKTGGNRDTAADQVVYRLNSSTNQIERSANGGSNYVGVTAPEVIVEELTFYVTGTGSSDGKQPRILIVIRGKAGTGRTQTDFNLQTTLSQRAFDL